jgi:hypothetical protein
MGNVRIARDPEAPARTRRAIDLLTAAINSLISSGQLTMVRASNWRINGDSEQQVLASEVFSKRVDLAGLPRADLQQILMTQVFTPRVSYGVIG